jgi:hypothetical protein
VGELERWRERKRQRGLAKNKDQSDSLESWRSWRIFNDNSMAYMFGLQKVSQLGTSVCKKS